MYTKSKYCFIILIGFLVAFHQNPLIAGESRILSDVRFNIVSTQHGLSQSSVFCIEQDHKGFIWIGTKDGLNRFDGYNFTVYRYNPVDSNSLSNNEITALHSDTRGFLWIGTRGGGLNRYDIKNNQFVRYSDLNYENFVHDIVESEDNSLWVGTSEGLFHFTYDEETGTHNYVNISQNAIFKDAQNQIIAKDRRFLASVSIFELSSDSMYIGTNAGVLLFEKSKKQFRRLDIGEEYASIITKILVDGRTMWLGTYVGLVKAVPDLSNPGKYDITLYSNTQPDDRYIRGDRVDALVRDDFGNIWAGIHGGGLVKIDRKDKSTTYLYDIYNANSLNDNIINSLLIDRSGVLWIGTECSGCNTLDLYRKEFHQILSIPKNSNSIGNNLITAISGSSNNKIWLGTAVRGIDKIKFSDDGEYEIENYEDIVAIDNGIVYVNEVISMLEDKDGYLWMGTASNSLTRFKEETGFTNYVTDGYVFSIHEDRHGRIWYGTWGQGLGLLDKPTGEITRFTSLMGAKGALSSDRVLAIFDDNLGNLWVGTKGGGLNVAPLSIITQGSNEFASYKHHAEDNNSLSHNDIYCITQDSKGQIWLGTGVGLNKLVLKGNMDFTEAVLKGEAKFLSYFKKDGLQNSVIYGILEDNKGNLWLSTNYGLTVFNPETEDFKNYGVNDGLQANEFHANAYFKDNNGIMYFGGVNGLTVFNPDSIKDNPFLPEVVISGLKVFNRKIKPGDMVNGRVILNEDITHTDNITLSHKEKEITIEFSALHYANPLGIQYKYRLLGFNDQWQFANIGNRLATYTNLKEGNYVFQVSATNNDGKWIHLPVELAIEILPPFWRTPWMYIFYTLIIVVGLLVFRKYSVIEVKQKNQLLIESIEREKLVEITEAKMRFFTNISHEIRSPLTLINDPLDKLLEEGNLDEKTTKQLNIVSKNTKRLLNLVNQLLQLRKIDLGNITLHVSEVALVPYLKEIIECFDHYIKGKNFNMAFICTEADIKVWIDKELITTVFYNLFSNALKYTPEEGRISIKIFKHEGSLEKNTFKNLKERIKPQKEITNWVAVEITDTGKGISTKELKNIFMRFYQTNDSSQFQDTGFGVGLSIVKEYVELHKGHIKVFSKPQKGSVFTVYFPEGKGHFNKENVVFGQSKSKYFIDKPRIDIPFVDKQNTEQDEKQETSSKKENPVILTIEDDRDFALYLVEYLKRNYTIHKVHDGISGIKKAKELCPDLIITDVMLPGKNGLEICKSLKSDVETSHIPIMMLTAKATEENIQEGYEYGADIYITKPVNVKILETQIKMLIESRNLLRERFAKLVYLKPKDVTITNADEKFLKRLMDVTEENIEDCEFDVTKLVDAMNMSHATILRKTKAITGLSLVDFIKSIRLKRAALILQKEKLPISEIGYMVGFSDPKYFSKCFIKEFGKTPTAYSNEFHEAG